MLARGALGHHAAEFGVFLELAQGQMGQDPIPAAQDRHRGVVEGGIDGQSQRFLD